MVIVDKKKKKKKREHGFYCEELTSEEKTSWSISFLLLLSRLRHLFHLSHAFRKSLLWKPLPLPKTTSLCFYFLFLWQLAIVAPEESSSLQILCLFHQKKSFPSSKINPCISPKESHLFQKLPIPCSTLQMWHSIMPKMVSFIFKVLPISKFFLLHW